MDTHQSDGVLEIVSADGPDEWRLEPDTQAEYPIVIRNQTVDTHEVEVLILDAVDWASVTPERFSLRSGKEITTKVVLARGMDARAPAGQHKLTLELADFEGTSLGQLCASVSILPYYRLQMSLRVRGPLLRRGVAEGFVLHCSVVNEGNIECTIHPEGDAGSPIVLAAPSVRVPFGGDVSFDIEAWWGSNPMRSYPQSVRVRAAYAGGDVTAEIPWDDVAAALGPMLPPLAEAEEFPDVLRLRSERVAEQDTSTAQTAQPPLAPEPAPPLKEAPVAPVIIQLASPRALKYTYGRRVNAWWPPAERFGGRWRVKPLPIAAFVVAAGLFAIAQLDTAHPNGAGLAPRILISTFFHQRAKTNAPAPRVAHRATKTRPALAHNQINRSTAPKVRPHAAAASAGAGGGPNLALPMAAPPRPQIAQHVHGSVWQGDVVHVSADNIKVSSGSEGVRSFIVSQNFKSVFSADGTAALPMTAVQPGAHVRVFYSYVLGFRHPNAIFVLSRPRSPR